MDNYSALQEQSRKLADSLPSIQRDISQHILWLKNAICWKIDNFGKKRENVYTFKENGKFGFSEGYVNEIIAYAYEKGRIDAYEHAQRNAQEYIDMVKKIKEIVCECDCNSE